MKLETAKLVALVDRMPGFSPAVAKIISLANNPKSSPGDLVNAVSLDSVLTAKILRLVNSAYFGPGRNIASLNRAVIMLGFNTIKNIALSVSVASSVSIRGDFKWFTNDEYWEHCIGCALASRELAKAAGVGVLQVEEYFVAGLLHDIGKAVLIHGLRREIEEVYDPGLEPGTPRFELESGILGVTHAAIGGMIARKWKFPETLAAAIEFHHAPLESPEEARMMALVTHVADYSSHHLKIGIQTSMNLDNISGRVWEVFGLTRDETLARLEGLAESVGEAKMFLKKTD